MATSRHSKKPSSYSTDQDTGGGLTEMLKHTSKEQRWYLHTDEQGVHSISNSQLAPGREELIRGWMSVPVVTSHGRDEHGYLITREHHLTRAEAEAKVARADAHTSAGPGSSPSATSAAPLPPAAFSCLIARHQPGIPENRHDDRDSRMDT